MWISKKKWDALEEKIADLKKQIKDHQFHDRFIPEDSNGKHFKEGNGCKASSNEKKEVKKSDDEEMVRLIHKNLNCYLIDGYVFNLLERRIGKCIQLATKEGFSVEDSETLKELMKLYQFTDKGGILKMSKRKIGYLIIRSNKLLSK